MVHHFWAAIPGRLTFLTTLGEELDSAGGEVRYALTSCDSIVAPEDCVADRQEIHDGCPKTLLVLLRL
jgi:hypothetical protein